MILVLGLACSAHHVPHYEPVGFSLAPLGDDERTVLDDQLEALIGTRAVRGWTPVTAPAANVAALPVEAKHALWICSRRWSRGAELDLLVDTGDGPRPVTLWWTPQRAVRIGWGEAAPAVPPLPPTYPLAEWQASLATEHGLGGVGSGFTERETGILAIALSHLTEAERRALAGVVLSRDAVSPRSAHRELAYFDPADEPPVLSFFDLAFADDALGFVGPTDAPLPAAAMTVLHEIGHTIADAPLRRAYVAYAAAHAAWLATGDPDDKQRSRDAFAAYRRLGRAGPVIAAWDAFRDGRNGPSTYGFRNVHESFAEAFALAHLDPAALERALPGAVAWFGDGEHVRAAGLADPDPGEAAGE